MRELGFSNWVGVLAQANISQRQKDSWSITLHWYLSFCRRGRARVNVQSARDFITWAQREKEAQDWQVEGWKEAIRWFFRAAKLAAGGQSSTANREHRATNVQHPTSNLVCLKAPVPGLIPIASQRKEGEQKSDSVSSPAGQFGCRAGAPATAPDPGCAGGSAEARSPGRRHS